MLDATNRLRSAEEFQATVRQGRRGGSPLLVCHFLDQDLARPPRIGFVVSKAIGNAVTRNLVKRRLRHLVRERVGLLPAGSMLVVRAQPPSACASYAALGSALDRCLKRVVAR